MSDPTGAALLARIKELEEALEDMLDLLDEVWDSDVDVARVNKAKQVLNK